ncbi:hypothetical protein [Methylobacterium durans]|uniref:hypothetical protein n=1 Tax=Methylobacterium durans TaxID=2202825 RepID=UPI0013A53985|nr:hypothetical protein [Methylobacterium durans]
MSTFITNLTLKHQVQAAFRDGLAFCGAGDCLAHDHRRQLNIGLVARDLQAGLEMIDSLFDSKGERPTNGHSTFLVQNTLTNLRLMMFNTQYAMLEQRIERLIGIIHAIGIKDDLGDFHHDEDVIQRADSAGKKLKTDAANPARRNELSRAHKPPHAPLSRRRQL